MSSGKTSKGKIVWDVCADYSLSECARKQGWKVIKVPNIPKLKDDQVSTKFAKGMHPIFTQDYTAYKENPSVNGATGYIEQEVCTPDQINDYKLVVEKFFKEKTSKDIKNKVYFIPLKKKPFIKCKLL